jgi:hypothetical protein
MKYLKSFKLLTENSEFLSTQKVKEWVSLYFEECSYEVNELEVYYDVVDEPSNVFTISAEIVPNDSDIETITAMYNNSSYEEAKLFIRDYLLKEFVRFTLKYDFKFCDEQDLKGEDDFGPYHCVDFDMLQFKDFKKYKCPIQIFYNIKYVTNQSSS